MTLLGVSMTDVASAQPLAGWYDDPADGERLRWWDGSEWTDNAMPKPSAVQVPTAPPAGPAYSVDERRVRDSPRRAARAAQQAEPAHEHLAPVLQLHRTPSVAPDAPEAPGIAEDALISPAGAELPEQPQSADPQADVPPSAVSQAAASGPAGTAFLDPHMPQLGLVPAAATSPDPLAAFLDPTFAVPAPGTMVTGPALDTLVDLAAPTPGSLVENAPAAPAILTPEVPAASGADLVSSRDSLPAVPSTPLVQLPLLASGAALAPSDPPSAPSVADGAAASRAARPDSDTGADVVVPVGLPASPAEFLAASAPNAEETGSSKPSLPVVTTALSWEGLVPGSSSTVASWLLAFAPWFAIAAQLAAVSVYVTMPSMALAAAGALLGTGLLSFVLAALDRHRLRRSGWQRPASVAFMLLGPFWYLVARQVRLRREGAATAPLLAVTLVNPVLAAAATVAAAYLFQEQLMSWLLILELRA